MCQTERLIINHGTEQPCRGWHLTLLLRQSEDSTTPKKHPNSWSSRKRCYRHNHLKLQKGKKNNKENRTTVTLAEKYLNSLINVAHEKLAINILRDTIICKKNSKVCLSTAAGTVSEWKEVSNIMLLKQWCSQILYTILNSSLFHFFFI